MTSDQMGTATAESLRAADACAPGVASVAPPPSPAPRLPLVWQYRHLMVPKGRRGPRPVAVELEPGIPRVPDWLAKPVLCVGVFALTWALSGSLLDAWSRHQRREAELTEAVRHAVDCAVHQARHFDDRLQAITDDLRVLERDLDLIHADAAVVEHLIRLDQARRQKPARTKAATVPNRKDRR